MHSQEVDLLARVRRGEDDAFRELVEIHQNRLFHSMCLFVGCPAEAEDVVQEALLLAYLRLDRFRGDSAFYSWLFRIARNCALSRRRRKRVEHSLDSCMERRLAEPVDQDLTPAEQLELQEQRENLHQALQRISRNLREILILREFENYDYESIADILNLNIGTVRSRLHRARVQLRNELEEYQDQDLPRS